MQKFLQNSLKYGLPLVLSIVLLFYAFRDINWANLQAQFARADYRWIFVMGIFGLLSHASRSYRWQLLLEPLGYRTRFAHAFHSVMSAYFINLIFPRAGEVSRCGLMQELDEVPISIGFGTVVVERVIDLIMLLGLILILLIVEFEQLSQTIFDIFVSKIPTLQGVLIFITAIAIGLGLVTWLWIRYKASLLKSAFIQKVIAFLRNVSQGFLSIRSVRNKPAFIFHTLFIWLMYYCMSFVLFYSFPETAHLDYWFGFIVLILGGLGMAAPVQGGIGTYHLLVGGAFVMRGMTQDEGIIMATYMHTAQTCLIIFTGGFSFLWCMVLIGRKKLKVSLAAKVKVRDEL
jgi:hypothetical protein